MLTDLKIVVVEDNEQLREEMVDFLTRPGWDAHGVDCGEELNEWLIEHSPDVVLLDVNLPYEDGYSIAERLRKTHPNVGIVMLTARVRPTDRTEGYQSGADVYLTKPTHTNELVAVIENLGRRLHRVEVQAYLLDRQTRSLSSPQGQRCNLTHGELRLLEILALSPAREIETDFLLERLGEREDKAPTRESIAALISRLRTKCKDYLDLDNLVVASRGVGYRLCVPLRLK